MKTSYAFVRDRVLRRSIVLVLLLSFTVTATAATSYLEELNEEAQSEGQGAASPAAPGNQPSWTEQQTTGNHETIEKGLTKEKFEQSLKSRFYGSYLFYSALSDAKQAAVYEEYKKNNEIEHLREVIKRQMTN